MIQNTVSDRLSLQNLLNAYCFEMQIGRVVNISEQPESYAQVSCGKAILELNLLPFDMLMIVPIERYSLLGQLRYSDTPFVYSNEKWVQPSAVSVASLILEDIVHRHEDVEALDSKGVLQRWIHSYHGLKAILGYRSDEIDDITELQMNFIQTEQNLIYGHAMHPTPKGREGFHSEEWATYAPETNSKFQLTYWLVDPKYIVDEFVDGDSICGDLVEILSPHMSKYQQNIIKQNPKFKLLPVHPWQARFLQKEKWYQQLRDSSELYNLGDMGWYMHPTTSVRTLAAFEAKWMFKMSLSVAITNSVRINLPKECKRGLSACKIWRSDYGQHLNKQYPTIRVLNDPAWIALKIDEKIIDETICILRDNPFTPNTQVTNLASLCQDHPIRVANRFNTLFNSIHESTGEDLRTIAVQWFQTYLDVAFVPLIDLYYQQGIGFEAHQQNSLIELKDGYPSQFWVRDNQGFGYIAEYAMALIDSMPELISEAECVVPEDFADFRFSYYLVGNSIFGLIIAIARTGLVSEEQLLSDFYDCLTQLEGKYPHRSLFDLLLRSDTLPFKGNLLTRMHALDELTAAVESQSIYVDIPNLIKPLRKAI